jgi:hypothetical protein
MSQTYFILSYDLTEEGFYLYLIQLLNCFVIIEANKLFYFSLLSLIIYLNNNYYKGRWFY